MLTNHTRRLCDVLTMIMTMLLLLTDHSATSSQWRSNRVCKAQMNLVLGRGGPFGILAHIHAPTSLRHCLKLKLLLLKS